MTLFKILVLARKYLGAGTVEAAMARHSLASAIHTMESGDLDTARTYALASLAHSVGAGSRTYKRAAGGR